MSATDPYNAVVTDRQDIHESLWHVWIKPDSGDNPPFKPGQFFAVGRVDETQPKLDAEGNPIAPKLIRRSYSVASDPEDPRGLELFVVKVDDGEFTPWLHELKVGDRVWLGRRGGGAFTLDGIRPDKDLVMVSTGTGLAPFVSMYRTHRSNPLWRRFICINGVRHARDLGFREELEAAAKEDPALIYLPMCTRESEGSGWEGLRGRVTSALEPGAYREITGYDLTPEDCHVFLCGNPAMIEQCETELTDRGFRLHSRRNPGTLHLEKYW